eukprot:1575056-Prymnesium_polylepis.1
MSVLLDCFVSDLPLADGRLVCLSAPGCTGVEGPVEKLLARRAVDWLREHHTDLLHSSGELSEEKLGDKARLARTLSRIVLDALLH